MDYSQSDDEQPTRKAPMPKKAQFRMRAHINPFNDTPFPFPCDPDFVDWSLHFPNIFGRPDQDHKIYCNTVQHPISYQQRLKPFKRNVDILDIGCGYGAFLFSLSRLFPTKLCFGLQIRAKVVNFVGQKIRTHRINFPGKYDNLGVVRTNTMRHLLQYFRPNSVQKIFVCFADPHFKAKNFRRRIINPAFIAQYLYILKDQGRIYCVTDVEDLHEWQRSRLAQNRLLKEISEQVKDSEQVKAMLSETDQSKKVERKKGSKYFCVFEKV